MSEERQPYLTDMRGMRADPQIAFPFGVQPMMDGTAYARIHPQDLETIKQYIAEQVHAALQPAMPGLPDVFHFIRVEATDQDGKKWKGILYGVEEIV